MSTRRSRLSRLLIIVACLYLIVTTAGGIFDLYRAGDKLADRERRLAGVEEERARLEREKARVEAPEFLEGVARDKLGLSKPGEQVWVIGEDLLKEQARVSTEMEEENWKKWARLITSTD